MNGLDDVLGYLPLLHGLFISLGIVTFLFTAPPILFLILAMTGRQQILRRLQCLMILVLCALLVPVVLSPTLTAILVRETGMVFEDVVEGELSRLGIVGIACNVANFTMALAALFVHLVSFTA